MSRKIIKTKNHNNLLGLSDKRYKNASNTIDIFLIAYLSKMNSTFSANFLANEFVKNVYILYNKRKFKYKNINFKCILCYKYQI